MRLLMVTPHLPPYQAANALLPHLLGEALSSRGHQVRFLTFDAGERRADTTYVTRRQGWLRATRLPQAVEAAEVWWKAAPLIKAAEVVHIHSSTWMNQVAARLAVRYRRPYLLTHYGTEIWHHDGKDLRFRQMNRQAHHVTFYSQALLARARELAVPMRAGSVLYPPVAEEFVPLPAEAREQVRRSCLPDGGVLLLNVKRLHPLADQATLLAAFRRVHDARPDSVLLIAGSGEEEQRLKAQAKGLGLGDTVRFLGLVPNHELAHLQAAADLFVLSSVLEATPTVALEALASGTPVVSTDNPGGLELAAIFAEDVTVVPQRNPEALAAAILSALRQPRRTRRETALRLAEHFRLPGVTDRYLALYQQAKNA